RLATIGALLVSCARTPVVQATAMTARESPVAELVARGREAAQRGDAVRAEQYLGLAIERGADAGAVLPLLLDACVRGSHLRAALNHAEPYLRLHPQDDQLRYLVANIHLGLGQNVQARKELLLLLRRDESNADAHFLLGVVEFTTDRESSARHFHAAARYTQDEEQRVQAQSRLAELDVLDRDSLLGAERLP
ncbi:MAG TPA: hypothetical protein VKP30_05855, partial [Polyangiaceae bacterium]|nr:hypothetical protein [Polyangiaceae bacterium]